MIVILVLIMLFAMFQVTMTNYLVNNPNLYQLDAYIWESGDFCVLQLGGLVVSLPVNGNSDYDMLTTLMIEQEYDLTKLKEVSYHKEWLAEWRGINYRKLRHAYGSVFADLKYFPIPESTDASVPEVTFENGWMDKRTYSGKRGYEGCDITGMEQERGFYPVLSMSDGAVGKVSWSEKGNWRIDIQVPSELCLYYAYLYSYSRDWQEGDVVKAGELPGFMGDTGYSTVKGTVENFDVYLHVNFYIKMDRYDELSMNPYWALCYLEKNRIEVGSWAVYDGYVTEI